MKEKNKMNTKITGYWEGQPISREKTPEEKLEDVNIKVEEANLLVALNENYENT